MALSGYERNGKEARSLSSYPGCVSGQGLAIYNWGSLFDMSVPKAAVDSSERARKWRASWRSARQQAAHI